MMKQELKQSAVRHSERLLGKLGEVMDVPLIAQDAIRREIEYATMDGYRITARNQNRNGDSANDSEPIEQ
jgi:hypothetical protein